MKLTVLEEKFINGKAENPTTLLERKEHAKSGLYRCDPKTPHGKIEKTEL